MTYDFLKQYGNHICWGALPGGRPVGLFLAAWALAAAVYRLKGCNRIKAEAA